MSDLAKCPTCKGAKEITGLGMIKKKCDKCSGIGWIEIKDNEKEVNSKGNKNVETQNAATTAKPKKQRGRPKKQTQS